MLNTSNVIITQYSRTSNPSYPDNDSQPYRPTLIRIKGGIGQLQYGSYQGRLLVEDEDSN